MRVIPFLTVPPGAKITVFFPPAIKIQLINKGINKHLFKRQLTSTTGDANFNRFDLDNLA
jgi:hypothetical protein